MLLLNKNLKTLYEIQTMFIVNWTCAIPQRQSRFEQAPQAMGGRGQGGPGGMGGPQQSGGSYGGGSAGGPRPLDEIRTRPPPRDMDRRDRREDYMPKRARHY